MARLAALMLASYAEIRDNMLTVVSAGVTRVQREDLPGTSGIAVALIVELSPGERPFPHEVRVEMLGPDDQVLGKVVGGIQIPREALAAFEENELGEVPMAVDLRPVGVKDYGWHRVVLSIDSVGVGELRFKVVRPMGAPVNREQRRHPSRTN